MDVPDLVRQHYSRSDIEDAVITALAGAGTDVDHLTVGDLGSVDQMHAGFASATRDLLARLGLSADATLLDVGCGLGGPARFAAAEYGCHVVGVDLSPDFIEAARRLTARVGLDDRVRFAVTSGDGTGLSDASIDAAILVHVGMNVEDKRALFTEVARVLRPGGRFGVYEQMQVGAGPLTYPLPWAEDARTSFVEAPEAYEAALADAGFTVETVEDRTAAIVNPGPPDGTLSPGVVFGSGFMERIGNNVAATRAGDLAPVVIIAARAG